MTTVTPFPLVVIPSGFAVPSPTANAASSRSASRCPSSSARNSSKFPAASCAQLFRDDRLRRRLERVQGELGEGFVFEPALACRELAGRLSPFRFFYRRSGTNSPPLPEGLDPPPGPRREPSWPLRSACGRSAATTRRERDHVDGPARGNSAGHPSAQEPDHRGACSEAAAALGRRLSSRGSANRISARRATAEGGDAHRRRPRARYGTGTVGHASCALTPDRLVRVADDAQVDLGVENVRGVRGCLRGARGSATIVDDQRFNARRLRRDAVAIVFGEKCRLATGRWSNVAGRTGRSAVTTTAR